MNDNERWGNRCVFCDNNGLCKIDSYDDANMLCSYGVSFDYCVEGPCDYYRSVDEVIDELLRELKEVFL